jgi:hypothetical protein
MTGPESSTENVVTPPRAANPRRTAFIVAVVVVFAIFFWLYASKLLGIRAAEREGLKNSAVALSAATLPLLDLRSKNLLGDAETLQRVVDETAETKRFSFVALLDNNGKVLVSSDRSVTAGSAYPDYESGKFVERGVDGKYEVIQPVRQGTATYGAVVLRLP